MAYLCLCFRCFPVELERVSDQAEAGVVNEAFSIDTTGMSPCGYSLTLGVWDRTNVNSGQTNNYSPGVGWLLPANRRLIVEPGITQEKALPWERMEPAHDRQARLQMEWRTGTNENGSIWRDFGVVVGGGGDVPAGLKRITSSS